MTPKTKNATVTCRHCGGRFYPADARLHVAALFSATLRSHGHDPRGPQADYR